MNKKNIVLLALTCGVVCQDAGASSFVRRASSAAVEQFSKNTGNFVEDGARFVTRGEVPGGITGARAAGAMSDNRQAFNNFTENLTNGKVNTAVTTAAKKGLVDRVKQTADEVVKAIKASGKTGWEGIKQGLENMKTQIAEIAGAAGDSLDDFALRVVRGLNLEDSSENIHSMETAIYLAIQLVVFGGVATGVAVHHKKKDQSKQEQDTQQSDTQQSDTQQGQQSDWQGFLYT